MEMDLPWTEKYRPKTLDEVAGQREVVERLKAYVRSKNAPHMIFAGRAGIGKTTAALAFVHDLFDAPMGNFLELNASVTPETPILIRENGKTKRTNFGELAHAYFTGKFKNAKYAKPESLEILSLGKDLRVGLKPVSLISRHKVGRVARIRYEGGVIRTSLNHSVIVFDNEGRLISKRVSELKKGDLLIAPKTVINSERAPLDFSKHAPSLTLRLRSGVMKNPKVKTVLQDEELTPELAWLFGLYAAEGCTSLRGQTSGSVIFTVAYPAEIPIVTRAEGILSSMGLNSTKKLAPSGFDRSKFSALQLWTSNTQLARFFRYNFYDGSENRTAAYKRIPPFMFSAPLEARHEFLKGYAGDASGAWGELLRYSSVSKDALIDMVWLSRLSGLEATWFSGKEARVVWRLPSYSYVRSELLPAKPFVELARASGVCGLPRALRHQLYSKKAPRLSRDLARDVLQSIEAAGNCQKETLARLKQLVDSELSAVRITGIAIQEYKEFVYDVSVPDAEMFWGGTSPILLHNSDERGIDVVREKIKDFAKTLPLDASFKIIFLDEADALTPDAQHALRRTMEKYAAATRFILSCNYSSKIIEPIQSRCAVFRFKPLGDEDVTRLLERIAKHEKLHVSEAALKAIIYVSEGDMRKAINALQGAAVLSTHVDEKAVYQVSSRARPAEIREMVQLALRSEFLKAREALDALMLNYGMSGEDVLMQVYREVTELDVPDRTKIELVEHVGEYDFRIVEGANERVQLEALLARIMLIGESLKQKQQ